MKQWPFISNGDMKPFNLLCLCSLIAVFTTGRLTTHGSIINKKTLNVGEELFKETLPLQNGERTYQLEGLNPNMWYEVKISYPASIPSSFSLRLTKDATDLGMNSGRKLLNTEKLIFKTDGMFSLGDESGIYVVVNVKPEGIVAISGTQEREYVIFNIVCDEMFLGILHKCWVVVVFVVICLVLAFLLPSFLPHFLLSKNGKQQLHDRALTKNS